MNASHSAFSDRVVLKCPACGATESAEAAVLSDAPMIVCRECGKTWPSAPRRTVRQLSFSGETQPDEGSDVLEAERKPFITYSDGSESAWAAKVEGDYWPEPPRRWHLPMLAGAVASVFFLLAFFGGREAAVRAMPDLAGLYAAIGLPVHLEGVAIEDVVAARAPTAVGDRVMVSGVIRNVSGRPMTVPRLTATLYDGAKRPTWANSFDPPAAKMGSGEERSFLLTLDAAPSEAANVTVRFRHPGERLPRVAEATTVQ